MPIDPRQTTTELPASRLPGRVAAPGARSRARWTLAALALLTLADRSPLRAAAPWPRVLATGAQQDLAMFARELESPDVEARARAASALERAGDAGARAALEGFRAASPVGREARARVLESVGSPAIHEDVAALADDPAAPVRARIAAALGRMLRAQPAPPAATLGRLAARLTSLAADDGDTAVRAAALEALSRADQPIAVEALTRIVRESAGADGARAARALAASPRGGEALIGLVLDSFEDPARRLDEASLVLLLAEGFGPALAERLGDDRDARDRRAFVMAERDPSPLVRSAGLLALQGFLSRARFLGAVPRAEDVCASLAAELADPAPALLAGAALTLSAGDDPARALRALERLAARLGDPPAADARARLDLAVAEHLRGAAELVVDLAAKRPWRGAARLDAARARLSALAGEGLERGGVAGARLASEVAGERAVVECTALLARLCAGEAPDAPACRALARDVHALALRSQLLAASGPLEGWTGDLDLLIQHPHGPFELLLSNSELGDRLDASRLDLQLRLARALATAAPEELAGFEPETRTPLDAERKRLVGQIEVARFEQVERELARLPQDAPERADLERTLRVLAAELAAEPDLHRVRLPSSLAIELAGDLRDDGRTGEAAKLARRAADSLGTANFLFGAPYLQELVARAEAIEGSCATDEGRPEEADRRLNAALERLETIARAGLDDLRSKATRSNVLVSLAVNANVKLGDPVRALAYFERAYELRQDDFTRTLLACYRARAGRKEEARALLSEMPVSPFNYYNLACTHALLGDVELALDYLAREFRGPGRSPGAVSRQKEWARTDPDLAALRGDPRFEDLVGR